ncbi:Transmembrane emp24 domain-containing protein 7 [Mactra antiquata]
MRNYISSFLVCVVMFGVQAYGTALTFELPDKRRFCLSERFEGPKDYIMDYRVIRGGKNDVDVFVKSPNGKILHKKKQVHDGTFEFESSRGDFSFCFSNEFSSWAHKVIYFDLRPRDVDSLAGEAGIDKPFAKTTSENSCDEIHEKMSAVVKHQRDYRLKESIGRHLAEVMRTHVSWWAFTQTLAILMAGLGQSFILKRFFTEKSSTTINNIEAEA